MGMRPTSNQTYMSTNTAGVLTYSDALDATKGKRGSIHGTVTVAASTADTFADADVSVANDTITLTAHGWYTGRKVAATTTGTLPAGLSATNYYIIRVDANTVKLASSEANAQAGTAVDITGAAGGGTHTLTPASLAGCTVTLQASNDETRTNWADVSGSAQSITATGDFIYEYAQGFGAMSYRLKFALTAGQLAIAARSYLQEETRG